jgi:peptidoglycan/LPS O-acetylase OafA/YrhL
MDRNLFRITRLFDAVKYMDSVGLGFGSRKQLRELGGWVPSGQVAATYHTRFEMLDGLRGVAALVVLAHHVGQIRGGSLLDDGYLCVDLFFVLSGFVMGHAYERSLLVKQQVGAFLRQRLIRLYPLMLLGLVAGLVVFSGKHSGSFLAIAFILQLLFIPRLTQPYLFELNGLQWSLFFELVANVAHALTFRWLTNLVLQGVVVTTGIMLIGIARSYGGLGVGWGPDNFIAGFPRVLFSYAVGVLLFRYSVAGRLPMLRIPWWAVLMAPGVIVVFARLYGWYGDVIAVFTWPIVVWGGIASAAPQWVRGFSAWAGAVSYPLYILQAPVLEVATPWLKRQGLSSAFGVSVGIVGLAWFAGRYYDEPIRRWLKRGAAGSSD